MLESEFRDDDGPLGELVVGLDDVVLKVGQAGTVPVLIRRGEVICTILSNRMLETYEVDVVTPADVGSPACVDELLEPVQALTGVGAVGNGREGLLDGERVDVLLVPLQSAL